MSITSFFVCATPEPKYKENNTDKNHEHEWHGKLDLNAPECFGSRVSSKQTFQRRKLGRRIKICKTTFEYKFII